MTNREQIMARIERDKARKAAKRYQKAHGTWKPEEPAIDLEGLNTSLQAVISGKKPARRFALEKINKMNQQISPEERLSRISPHGEFRWVFTMQNLMKSLQKRRKGVEWKGNVQKFLFHAVLKLKHLKDNLLKGKLDVDGTIRTIVLHERGKRRLIHAVLIDCRVVQGCLCDCCMIPLTEYRLIRDNPASVKGKGVSDARRRVEMFLHELARKYGCNFWLEISDFKKFFDSLRHIDCWQVMKYAQIDIMLQGLGMKITRMYQEGDIAKGPNSAERLAELRKGRGVGLTLGSQLSQIMALVIPSPIDHAVKDKQGIRAYERYMDDTLSGSNSKDELKQIGRTILAESAKFGLRLNPKKTAIVKASKGITFLQIHYHVTETGKLIKTLARAGIVRMRRKLKKFARKVRNGEMTLDHVFNSFSSWFGNSKLVSAYRTRKKMLSCYNQLFHRYRTGGMYA